MTYYKAEVTKTMEYWQEIGMGIGKWKINGK